MYLSPQSDDTGKVAPVLSHTLEVAQHTLELCSLSCHSPLTVQREREREREREMLKLLQHETFASRLQIVSMPILHTSLKMA